MGEEIKRELTLVEGREPNQNMARELISTAKKMGWKAKLLKSVPFDKIIHNQLDEVFSDFVIWRGPVDYRTQYEIERTIYWINHNCRVTINTHPEGGRMNTSDKFFQHACFLGDEVVAKHSLPMYPAISKDNVLSMVSDKVIDYPFVLKPDFGTRGEGIVLINTEDDLNKFKGDYARYSAEPFIKSKYDWRVFVLGGSALGAMRKVGDESNVSDFMAKSGGRERWNEDDVDIREELYDLAVRVTAASGLEYAGVDLIRDDSTGRFVVLETNIAGGWQNGFLEATGVHIPTKIVQWLGERAKLLEGKDIPKAVSDYVQNRRGFLSRASKKDFEDIIHFRKKIVRDRRICNIDIESRDMPLIRKLSSAYALVANYELTDVEKAKLEMFINEVEKYEISRYGNFIGKDSGSLEQSMDATAYYLAISSKL
jgi:hypothetical protein